MGQYYLVVNNYFIEIRLHKEKKILTESTAALVTKQCLFPPPTLTFHREAAGNTPAG